MSLSQCRGIDVRSRSEIQQSYRSRVRRIETASVACRDMVKNGMSLKSDNLIIKTPNLTDKLVQKIKEEKFRQADEYQSEEQKCIIYGRTGLAVSLRLEEFIDATNKLLTSDDFDHSDQRNDYRQCPHCDAIFNKAAR